MGKGAFISADGKYRYSLGRLWDSEKGRVMFIMLNPSTADAEQDDPTIRRCISFAKSWGYGGLYVCNLYAYRATNPKELQTVNDPVGFENDAFIRATYLRDPNCDKVVFACGSSGPKDSIDRINQIMLMLNYGIKFYCLGTTKSGLPKHPLYLKSNTSLVEFSVNTQGNR